MAMRSPPYARLYRPGRCCCPADRRLPSLVLAFPRPRTRRSLCSSKEDAPRGVTDVLLVAGVDGFVTALNCTEAGAYGVMVSYKCTQPARARAVARRMGGTRGRTVAAVSTAAVRSWLADASIRSQWVRRIGNTPLVQLAGAVTAASPGRRGSPRASTERFFPGADGSVFLAQANAGDHDGASDAPGPTFSRLPYLPHDVVRSGEPARVLQAAVFRSDFITSITTLDLATGAVLSKPASGVPPDASVPFSAPGQRPAVRGPSVLFSRVDRTVHVSGGHSSADYWNLTLASIELPGIIPGPSVSPHRLGRVPSGL